METTQSGFGINYGPHNQNNDTYQAHVGGDRDDLPEMKPATTNVLTDDEYPLH